ncbi:uncharacterized protein A1O9_05594 [Exophiala aquamarina CBS 119918]|uniref:Phospholipid/glycerol acyltransferase domain-containing protein n=1 Tax=Exophiala aquamarina CBS 119918 TaxID=1182545 RepID=A0A072PCV7_9EURO|nr:uncharacterized protein A1O9_05594 [Exophiala aquamarina CBS 119918]KEF57676.1 hypothetical protein A1O9_05594 [Exophiala aquamarina CBS 119918]
MSTISKAPALEPAAGFSLESKASRPDRVPLQKGEFSVASRAVALSTYFLSGALAINLSQFLGAPLSLVNEDWYNAWIAFTKQSFGLLTMTLTQTFAPTKVIVSGDASVRGQLLKSAEGNLTLDFPERLVLIANHQIYTDWLYLWWIAYCNGMHGRLYIILKESLKKIPVLGWGMQLSQFIFLKRKWEEDKPNMAIALQKLNKVADPMWLLLFPEGTNLAPSTRAKSAAWAKKNNISDMKHVLLPRSTGLQFCLDELKNSVDYVYDCTVAYEGVPRGQYAQDIFTLKAGYLEGRPPKSVNMYWRRFTVKDIPLHSEKLFNLWLTARWREKDLLMEHYLQFGQFPADRGGTRYKSGKVLRGCGHMEVPIQASRWYEFLQIFAPMGILAMVLAIFYGDLPKKFWKSINKQAVHSGTEDIKRVGSQAANEAKNLSTSARGLTLDSFFDPAQQEETFKSGAMAVQKLLTSPSAQKLLGSADFIQQFLSDPQKMVTDSITTKQKSFMQDLAIEEARRQQKTVPGAPVGSVKSLRNGTVAKRPKGTFWDTLEAEERSRDGTVVHRGQKAKFWDALDAEEKSRQGPAKPQRKGTFWQDLQTAEEKKGGVSKGNFWENVKAEENSRYGTVVTLSSNDSTAVGSISSGVTKSSAPKLGLRKADSSIGPTKNHPKPISTTTSTSSGPTKKPTVQQPQQKPLQNPPSSTTTTTTTITSNPRPETTARPTAAAEAAAKQPTKPRPTKTNIKAAPSKPPASIPSSNKPNNPKPTTATSTANTKAKAPQAPGSTKKQATIKPNPNPPLLPKATNITAAPAKKPPLKTSGNSPTTAKPPVAKKPASISTTTPAKRVPTTIKTGALTPAKPSTTASAGAKKAGVGTGLAKKAGAPKLKS